MNSILITVNVIESRSDQFIKSIRSLLNKLESNDREDSIPKGAVRVKVNLISNDLLKIIDWQDLSLDHPKYLNLSIDVVDSNNIGNITFRKSRVGNMMNHRFDEKFSYIFLMDDDMEIEDVDLFLNVLYKSSDEASRLGLSFIKFSTKGIVDTPNHDVILGECTYPWMGNGILLKYAEYRIPENMMDMDFFFDDAILMSQAKKLHGPNYAQCNSFNGLIHHHRDNTDKDLSGIPLDTIYLMTGKYMKLKRLDHETMNLITELFNKDNLFKV